MREELRRAGGMVGDGSAWTHGQHSQRRNVAERLSVAYQSYRTSIHDIENLRFRNAHRGDGNSRPGNSCRESRPASNVTVLSNDSRGNSVGQRARDFPAWQRRVVAGSSASGDQVIDLTD